MPGRWAPSALRRLATSMYLFRFGSLSSTGSTIWFGFTFFGSFGPAWARAGFHCSPKSVPLVRNS
ncbi:hypothetical protein N665_0073s0066 [Sinapis alba]|nr:hypothetical protein N665_0073s0066 [Sinapis alba]